MRFLKGLFAALLCIDVGAEVELDRGREAFLQVVMHAATTRVEGEAARMKKTTHIMASTVIGSRITSVSYLDVDKAGSMLHMMCTDYTTSSLGAASTSGLQALYTNTTTGLGATLLCERSHTGYYSVHRPGRLTGIRIPAIGYATPPTVYYIMDAAPGVPESRYPGFGPFTEGEELRATSWLPAGGVGLRELSMPFIAPNTKETPFGRNRHILAAGYCEGMRVHPAGDNGCGGLGEAGFLVGVEFVLAQTHRVLAQLGPIVEQRRLHLERSGSTHFVPPRGHDGIDYSKTNISRIFVVTSTGRLVASTCAVDLRSSGDLPPSGISKNGDTLVRNALLHLHKTGSVNKDTITEESLQAMAEDAYEVPAAYSVCAEEGLSPSTACPSHFVGGLWHGNVAYNVLVSPVFPKYSAFGMTALGGHANISQAYASEVLHIIAVSENPERNTTNGVDSRTFWPAALRTQKVTEIRNATLSCLSTSLRKNTQTIHTLVQKTHNTFIAPSADTTLATVNHLLTLCTAGLSGFIPGVVKTLFALTLNHFCVVQCDFGAEFVEIGVQTVGTEMKIYRHRQACVWDPSDPPAVETREYNMTEALWKQHTSPTESGKARAVLWSNPTDPILSGEATVKVTRAVCGYATSLLHIATPTASCPTFEAIVGAEVDVSALQSTLSSSRECAAHINPEVFLIPAAHLEDSAVPLPATDNADLRNTIIAGTQASRVQNFADDFVSDRYVDAIRVGVPLDGGVWRNAGGRGAHWVVLVASSKARLGMTDEADVLSLQRLHLETFGAVTAAWIEADVQVAEDAVTWVASALHETTTTLDTGSSGGQCLSSRTRLVHVDANSTTDLVIAAEMNACGSATWPLLKNIFVNARNSEVYIKTECTLLTNGDDASTDLGTPVHVKISNTSTIDKFHVIEEPARRTSSNRGKLYVWQDYGPVAYTLEGPELPVEYTAPWVKEDGGAEDEAGAAVKTLDDASVFMAYNKTRAKLYGDEDTAARSPNYNLSVMGGLFVKPVCTDASCTTQYGSLTARVDFGTIEEHLRQFPQLRVAVVHQNGLLLASSVGPSVRLVADPRGGAGSQLWGPDHPSINVRDAVRLRLEGRTEGLVNSVPVVLKSAGIASLNGPDGPAELLIAMDTSKLAPTNEYSDTKVRATLEIEVQAAYSFVATGVLDSVRQAEHAIQVTSARVDFAGVADSLVAFLWRLCDANGDDTVAYFASSRDGLDLYNLTCKYSTVESQQVRSVYVVHGAMVSSYNLRDVPGGDYAWPKQTGTPTARNIMTESWHSATVPEANPSAATVISDYYAGHDGMLADVAKPLCGDPGAYSPFSTPSCPFFQGTVGATISMSDRLGRVVANYRGLGRGTAIVVYTDVNQILSSSRLAYSEDMLNTPDTILSEAMHVIVSQYDVTNTSWKEGLLTQVPAGGEYYLLDKRDAATPAGILNTAKVYFALVIARDDYKGSGTPGAPNVYVGGNAGGCTVPEVLVALLLVAVVMML